MDKKLLSLNGVFAVYKPAGISSAKMVDLVKKGLFKSLSKADNNRRMWKQVKVGHGGTLDPMATGVLVIGLNGGCKELASYLSGSKAYIAQGRFGEHFDTLDVTGKLIQVDDQWMEKAVRIPGVTGKFVGDAVMQVPPAFSAIHVNGKRAYELAREESNARTDEKEADGAETVDSGDAVKPACESNSVQLSARPVTIYSLHYEPLSLPEFKLSVSCGGGCYIRSLIRDLAAEVGSLAVMTQLERSKQGIFDIDACLKSEQEWSDLVKVDEAISKSKALI